MSTNTYIAGTLVRETGNFFDLNGEAADPAAVTLQYQAGAAGAVTTVTYASAQVIRQSTGVYYYDIDTSGWAGPGTVLYAVQWLGTGEVQVVGADYFEVAAPPIPPA
jgi:hypothetical protein